MAATEYYEFYEVREIVENKLPYQAAQLKHWLGSGNSIYLSCENVFEGSFDSDDESSFDNHDISSRNVKLQENCGNIFDLESLEFLHRRSHSGSPEASHQPTERHPRLHNGSFESPASIRSVDFPKSQELYNEIDNRPVASWNIDFMPATFHFHNKESTHKSDVWDPIIRKSENPKSENMNKMHSIEPKRSNSNEERLPQIYNIPINVNAIKKTPDDEDVPKWEPHHLRNKINMGNHQPPTTIANPNPYIYQNGPVTKPILKAVTKAIDDQPSAWAPSKSKMNEEVLLKLKDSVENMINEEFMQLTAANISPTKPNPPKFNPSPTQQGIHDMQRTTTRNRNKSETIYESEISRKPPEIPARNQTGSIYPIPESPKEDQGGGLTRQLSSGGGIIERIMESGKMAMGIVIPGATLATQLSPKSSPPDENAKQFIVAADNNGFEEASEGWTSAREFPPNTEPVINKSTRESTSTISKTGGCSRDRQELMGAMEWSMPPALESECVPGGPPFDVGFIYNRIPQGTPAHLLADLLNSCQDGTDLCIWMGQEVRDERVPVVNTFLSRVIIIVIDQSSFPETGIEGHTNGSTLPMFYRKIFAAMNSRFAHHVIISMSGNKSMNTLLQHAPEIMAEYLRKQFIETVRNNWIKSGPVIELVKSIKTVTSGCQNPKG